MRGTLFFSPILAALIAPSISTLPAQAQGADRPAPARPRGPIVPPPKPKPRKPDFHDFTLGRADTPTPRDPNPSQPVDQPTPYPAESEAPSDPPEGGPASPAPAPPRTRGEAPATPPGDRDLDGGKTIAYTPLVIIAAIHRIVSFPIPFTAALITYPEDSSKVEIANAIITAQHPSPFDVTLEFRAPGKPPKTETTRAHLGFLPLAPPEGYGNGTVLVRSATPLIAWKIAPFEEALFGIDRQRFFRRFVAPVGSRYRIEVQSLDSIPWDRLPANPKAITEDPVLSRPWKAFLDAAQQTKM